MLECIRFIENGKKIKMIPIDYPTIGIDTPNDLIEAKKYLESIKHVCIYVKFLLLKYLNLR